MKFVFLIIILQTPRLKPLIDSDDISPLSAGIFTVFAPRYRNLLGVQDII